jgi:hypothetical protein
MCLRRPLLLSAVSCCTNRDAADRHDPGQGLPRYAPDPISGESLARTIVAAPRDQRARSSAPFWIDFGGGSPIIGRAGQHQFLLNEGFRKELLIFLRTEGEGEVSRQAVGLHLPPPALDDPEVNARKFSPTTFGNRRSRNQRSAQCT